MLIVTINGRDYQVSKADYIRAKTADLREFGYESLTEAEVAQQVEQVLADGELSVIGHFIKDDIIGEAN